MLKFRRKICLIVLSALSFPAHAAHSDQQQDPPIIKEFQEHPVGYSLIGVGTALSFIGFGGLFAGGTNPGYYCEQEKNKRAGESEEDCRGRVYEQNAKFYRTMAGILGTGLLLAGTGGGLILWKNTRGDYSDNITLSISNETPTVIFTVSIP